MKELDYIRYERCETRNWYRTFAGKDGEEFELVVGYNYSLTHYTLHYKGTVYKFKEIINPEIQWEYTDIFMPTEEIAKRDHFPFYFLLFYVAFWVLIAIIFG